MINLPNMLSLIRIAAVPLLLWLAWRGLSTAFLILLAATLLTDALDGLLARLLHQETELGARLDSLGDHAIYVSVPLGCWWLWPELILRELGYVVVLAIAFTVPILAALIKFRTLACYHTWLIKLTAVVMALGILRLFATGEGLLFHIGVVTLVIASLEEMAITLVLEERRSNVRSLYHVLRARRADRRR